MRHMVYAGEQHGCFMSEPNYAGNIIVNLASLPDFLREPILRKRMVEFFSLPESEKKLIVNNALEAGPTIPFPNFSKLFKTWLDILTTFPEEQRRELFLAYINEAAKFPQKLISFNLDGILEIFLMLDKEKRDAIAQTVKNILGGLSEEQRRVVLLIIPDNAKVHLGV